MRPIVLNVTKEAAEPFVRAYCKLFRVPYTGDPNFGYDVSWHGAIYEGALRAVVGYLPFEDADGSGALYITGLFGDKSVHETRAIIALIHVMETSKERVYGHVRKNNHKMIQSVKRRKWSIQDNGTIDLLVCNEEFGIWVPQHCLSSEQALAS